MDVQNKYNFYVGTVRGVLGNTQCAKNMKPKFTIDKSGTPAEITALEWGRSDEEIVIGNSEGEVKLYSIPDDTYISTISDFEGKGPVVGLVCNDTSVFVARKSGHISLRTNESSDVLEIQLDEKGSLDKMAFNAARENVIGTGGEWNNFRLWDVTTKECIFQAKSLGHDELNLPIPTSIRDICFVPSDEKLSCCATKEGMVLMYDERAQRRPVVKFTEPKASYTAISTAYRERQCLVGTTRGYLQLLDLRSPAKCLKTFKSFTGGITSIVCDPIEPIVASASMDRFLRVHHLETKELLHKEYLKQSLTKILMKPIVKIEKEEPEDGATENVDEEYEALFDNMETVSDEVKLKSEKKSKKHKRRLENNNFEVAEIEEGEVMTTKVKKGKKNKIDLEGVVVDVEIENGEVTTTKVKKGKKKKIDLVGVDVDAEIENCEVVTTKVKKGKKKKIDLEGVDVNVAEMKKKKKKNIVSV